MKNAKGFTLIELMIVVAIIGILSAIAIPKFADLIRKSNEGATKGNLGAIRSAMSIYYGEIEGWYPVSNPAPILTMENGKYLKEIPASYEPPYHVKSAVFEVNNGTENANAGSWAYMANRTPAADEKPWGDVWVNCTHTDSKAMVWSMY
jgi:prepilin-type N-terminal cleavage/methylation domain-containing protein